MKAQELRIWNIVGFKNRTDLYCVVKSIYSPGIHVIRYFNSGEEDDQPEVIEDITPIPLTEDWHNKFGIKKNGFKNFVYELPLTRIAIKTIVVFTQDYVVIRSFDGDMQKPSIADNIVTIWNKDKMKRDMFVHEWQNLYFALTGEELKIN